MAKLLPPSSSGGAIAKISQPSAPGAFSSPLSDGLLKVRTKVIDVDKVFKSRLADKKKEEKLKLRQGEKEKRAEKEEKLETKPNAEKKEKKSKKIPGMSFLDKIKNFIGSVLLGFFAYRLVDHAPKLLIFAKAAGAAGDFIINWGGKIFDGLVTFLDSSYSMYDGLKSKTRDLFGESGVKQLENFADSFKKVANYTLITAMAFGNFGEGAAKAQDKLQQQAATKAAKPLAKAATRGLIKLFGKQGARFVFNGLKLVTPVIKKIPIIGPLVNFLISYFIFKEPVGKAALRAVGSAIFGALGAVAGSIIPVVGTAIGGFLGSVAGDYGGGWLYDTFFKGKESLTAGAAPEQRPSPGQQPVTGRPQQAGPITGSNAEKWKAFYAMAQNSGAKYPELVAAQFALESDWGRALSAQNNFFGIKATKNESATLSKTQEVYGGVTVNTAGRFKNFATPQDAVNHLVTQWYKDYKSYRGVNNAASAFAAADMLRAEGYATDPRYSFKLKRLLNQYAGVVGSSRDIQTLMSQQTTSTNNNIQTQNASMTNAGAGSKLAGELGRFLDSKGLGGWGSGVHQHPEHPPWPPESGHRVNSLHYRSQGGRAIDIGGYGPNLFRRKVGDGVDDQTQIIAAVREFNAQKGVKPVEFAHEGNEPRGHADHVHVAYARGGQTLGYPHRATLGERGREVVVDTDSSIYRPIKNMLLAINQASTYAGVLGAIADYAPYEDIFGPQMVFVQQPSGSQSYGQSSAGSAALIPIPVGDMNKPMDILYKGA